MTPFNQRRRRLTILAIAVLTLVAVAAAVVVARQRSDSSAGAPVAESSAGMSGMDGMAGMNMSGDGAVQLTANQIRTFGVTFGFVEERTLTANVRTVGLVTVDETRVARVTAKFSGYVERLYVEETGRPVRRGQALAAIYSPELLAAQEELLVALRLERAVGGSGVPGVPGGSVDLVGAARRRLRLLDMSEARIQEIVDTGRVRRAVTLSSPASGVVTEKTVVEGQAIQAGQPLYTITDLDRVWVEAELSEGQIADVRDGTGAEIEVAAYPGRTFRGRVEFIQPTVDPQARTVAARVAVSNSAGLLKPGMFATVRLETPTRRALTVPASALLRTGQRTLAFVDLGEGRFAAEEVEVGRATGDYVEILAGLEPGQRVVTSAQFLLDSESNLAEVMRAMMGQMGSSDMQDMGGMDMGGAPTDKGADVKGAMQGMPMPPPSTPNRR